jgi:nitroimidazol reductase NimA-like FMN-containing flavoprotein (pyridoxamine 5'-phosphate oxidase superfamily)
MTVETLEAFGVEQMSAQSIADFLTSQGVGVLALPTDGVPYILPLSFGYDGDQRLYFTYIIGDTSRKATLSSDDTRASVLVYEAETPFHWRSVICEGTVQELSKSEWDAHEEAMTDNAWHPDLFEQALETDRFLVYQLEIEEWTGLRHSGLPPKIKHPTS